MARDTITKRAAEPETGTDETSPVDETEIRTRRVVKDDGEQSPVGRGWSVDKRSSGSKTPQFKVPAKGEEILFKFIDDLPFASFWQHWLGDPKNRKSYVCIAAPKKDTKPAVSCPLCEIGDEPKSSDYINVIDLSDTANPVLKVWYMTASPAKAVRERTEVKRTSPINKEDFYWVASKSDEQYPKTSIELVKSSDLMEDWDMEPLTVEQINEFAADAYGPELVKISTKRELAAVVEELS